MNESLVIAVTVKPLELGRLEGNLQEPYYIIRFIGAFFGNSGDRDRNL